jgi:predicted Zn-dependent protease
MSAMHSQADRGYPNWVSAAGGLVFFGAFARRASVWLLRLAWVLGCTVALSAPYPRQVLRQLLIPGAQGQSPQFDVNHLDALLRDLGRNAGDYPARFDSTDDRLRARSDAIALMRLMGQLFAETRSDQLLLRMGALGALAHNLELPQGAEYAQRNYQRLLGMQPDHPLANYQYGRFLAASARPQEALPYLQSARRQGVAGSDWALGLAYLGLGNRELALHHLECHQRQEPGDQRAGQLMEAIRAGKVEVRQKRGP